MIFASFNEGSIQLQAKVFTRWVLNVLEGHCNQQINDITKDLSNGIVLIDLAKILTHKQIQREWNHSPKRKVEMIQNCDLALDMFKKDGICISEISGNEINENNEKSILGLIWKLILHYSINKSIESNNESKENFVVKEKNKKNSLLKWATDRITNYPNINDNFHPYDLSLCALLDSYNPDRINYYSLNQKNSEDNSKFATNVMKDLGIPVYLYPDEIVENDNKIDEKIVLTQLSPIKNYFDSHQKNTENDSKVSIEDEMDEAQKVQEIAEAEVDRLKRELETAKSNINALNKELKNDDLKIQFLTQQIEQINNSNKKSEKFKNALNKTENTDEYLSQRFIQKNWHNEMEIERLKENIICLNDEIQRMKKQSTIQCEQIQPIINQCEIEKLSISESNSHDFNFSNNQDEINKLQKAYSDAISMCNKLANQYSELQKNYKDEIKNLTNEISLLNKELSKSKPQEQLKNDENIELVNEMKISYNKLEDEFKRYKNASDNIMKEMLNESNIIKSNDKKQKEIIQAQEEKIKQQKEDLNKSEKRILLITSLLKETQNETKVVKNKLRETEFIAKSLSETLDQLDKETKYRYQVDSTEISNALLDAQNEREAKEKAQLNAKRLSFDLKKSVAEATMAKNAKEVAFQNVNELSKQLKIALNEADKNKNKADEAERIAFNLSTQLNCLHRQYKEDEKEKEKKIFDLEKEVDFQKKEKENAFYEIERLTNALFESEETVVHQKNQADFEIDRLNDQIKILQSDVEEFKEANEKFALKIQKLSTDLVIAQSESKEHKNQEIEATRIAQQLSKTLKDFDEENRNTIESNKKILNEAISSKENERIAKENALIEVDNLKKTLENVNDELSLSKLEKEKAQSDLFSLSNQFEKLLNEMQKNKLIKAEAERLAANLSESLDAALKESKAQREENELALKEARKIAINEQNEKEAAQKEVDRLTKELNETEQIAIKEKEQNKKLKYKAEILSNALIQSQKQNEQKNIDDK